MKQLESVINLKCCSAHIGYGGILIIGLGRLVEYESPKLKSSFHGEWEIRTNSASWRLLKDHKIIVGEYDDETDIKKTLQLLVDCKLTNIESKSQSPDIQLKFKNNLTCEILGISNEEYSWEIIGSSTNLVILPTGKKETIDRNFVDSLDPTENTNSEYALSCAERWESVIPKQSDSNNCNNCYYYRGLEGQYNFWDYGLCTCAKSHFDGKVVNVKSTCSCYEGLF